MGSSGVCYDDNDKKESQCFVCNVLGCGGKVVAGGLDGQRRHLPGVQGGEAGHLLFVIVLFCR